jgi:hypothetical protein
MRHMPHHHRHARDLYGLAALIATFVAALFFARLVAAAIIAAGDVLMR